MWKVLLYVLVVIAIILLIIVAPLLIIWSVNTLFDLGISYNIKTWFAMLILGNVFFRFNYERS